MMSDYQGVGYMSAYVQEEVEVVGSLNLYSPDFQGNRWAQPIKETFIIMSTSESETIFFVKSVKAVNTDEFIQS